MNLLAIFFEIMKINIIKKAYYFIIPILVIGISLGFTSFPLTLLALLPLIFLSDRHAVGVFFLMYGGPLGGVIRAMYPSIPIYGLLLQLVGVLLMWDMVLELLRKNSRAIWGMLLVLIIFGFFYVIGPRDEFAQNKYATMVIHGLVMVLGYYAFCQSKRINAESLTLILMVAAICMFAFCISKYNFTTGGLLDYNWFRAQSMQHVGKWATGEHMLVGYQHIGMLVLFGSAIYLSQVNLTRGLAIFYTLCAFQLIMVSGCRQAILGILVIVAFRLAVFRERYIGNRHFIRNLLLSGIGLVMAFGVIFIAMTGSTSDAVQRTLAEGDEGRQMLFLEAVAIFQGNPLTGAGIGGFNAITDDSWPHNFFLELLSETGLVGTLSLLVVVIYALYKRKAGLMYVTSTGLFYFLFLMSLFVRVLVSSDFTESIELFSAIFAISASKHMVQNWNYRLQPKSRNHNP